MADASDSRWGMLLRHGHSHSSICMFGGDMKQILLLLATAALLLGQAPAVQAQGANAAFPECMPAAPVPLPAVGGRGEGARGQAQAPQRTVRDVTTMVISGVVAAGAKWTKV